MDPEEKENNEPDFGKSINELWQIYGDVVAARDAALSDLGYIAALLWCNYGPDGKTMPGLIKKTDSIREMLESILKFLHRQLSDETTQSDSNRAREENEK